LKVTEAAKFLAKAFNKQGPIPKNAEIDAYHIAIATILYRNLWRGFQIRSADSCF